MAMPSRKFNPFDPLGVLAATKRQVDNMANKAGLPPLPNLPGSTRSIVPEPSEFLRVKGVGGLTQSILRQHRWTIGQ
jgi:hypothetical protein